MRAAASRRAHCLGGHHDSPIPKRRSPVATQGRGWLGSQGGIQDTCPGYVQKDQALFLSMDLARLESHLRLAARREKRGGGGALGPVEAGSLAVLEALLSAPDAPI